VMWFEFEIIITASLSETVN